jgi:hypothetical protein
MLFFMKQVPISTDTNTHTQILSNNIASPNGRTKRKLPVFFRTLAKSDQTSFFGMRPIFMTFCYNSDCRKDFFSVVFFGTCREEDCILLGQGIL